MPIVKSSLKLLTVLLGVLAIAGSGCAKKGQEKSAEALENSPPATLAYSTNPAAYTIDQKITPNTLSTEGGEIRSASIARALPDGLTFNATNGEITGTPTAITPSAEYIVTASNGNGSDFVRLVLAVNDILPTITYTGETNLVYNVAVPIAAVEPTLAGGATIRCEAFPALPSGLTLSDECVLSGTPLVPRSATNFLISAINSGGAASITLNIQVKDIPPTISYAGSPFTYYRGIAISALTPTKGGGAITSCSAAPALPAGLSLSSTCTLSGTPTVLQDSTEPRELQ